MTIEPMTPDEAIFALETVASAIRLRHDGKNDEWKALWNTFKNDERTLAFVMAAALHQLFEFTETVAAVQGITVTEQVERTIGERIEVYRRRMATAARIA